MKAPYEVYDTLRKLKDTKGINDKKAIIKAEWGPDKPEHREIVDMLFNPYRKYGINYMPQADTRGEPMEWPEVRQLLLDMESRKLTGNNAKRQVQYILADADPAIRQLTVKILTKKPDCGLQARIINAVWPDFIPTFNVMLAEPHKHNEVELPALGHPKLDGVRVIIHVDTFKRVVTYLSREGRPFTALRHLDNSFLMLADAFKRSMMFDGEAVSNQQFYDVNGAMKRQEMQPQLGVALFDCMPLKAFHSESFHVPQRQRIDVLIQAVDLVKPEQLSALPYVEITTKEQEDFWYSKWLEQGLEGAVYKDPDALYVHKRHKSWTKRKNEDTDEMTIVGAKEGTGNDVGLVGALTVRYHGVLSDVGIFKCDRSERQYIWDCHKRGTLIGRLGEFSWHELTPDGKLRHGRYLRFRDTEDAPGEKI